MDKFLIVYNSKTQKTAYEKPSALRESNPDIVKTIWEQTLQQKANIVAGLRFITSLPISSFLRQQDLNSGGQNLWIQNFSS